MTIFLDSSFFKALLDEKDEFFPRAVRVFSFCHKQQAKLVTTNYIVDETLTLLRVRCGLPIALKLRELLTKGAQKILLIRVSIEDEAEAWDWFEKPWSKLSFTDCVSFAVMKRLGLTDVATFDQHFSKAGFKILKP